MKTNELKDLLRYVKEGFAEWEIDRDWQNIECHFPIESADKIHYRVEEWCEDNDKDPEEIWESTDEEDIFVYMSEGER